MRKLLLLSFLFASPAWAAGVLVYDNPAQSGAPSAVPYFSDVPLQVFDDAHTIGTGVLKGFDVWLWNHEGGPVGMSIAIYAGDAADGMPGALLAGPYTVTAISQTAIKFYHLDVSDAPLLDTTDLWFSVTSPVANAAAVWYGHDPTIGTSHNLLRIHDATGDWVDAGSSDPSGLANLRFAIYVDPAVQTEPKTWGKIKALYRGDPSIQ